MKIEEHKNWANELEIPWTSGVAREVDCSDARRDFAVNLSNIFLFFPVFFFPLILEQTERLITE